ncbi:MAG: glycosyltransferase family 2 protein [Bacteroidales bacterium]|nr:glycosyltransferase family 2 protein [Bacteroidales bacterium]
MPKVSVCLLTYNRAKYLPSTLDTILAQSLRDFELIISDNCSTDNTLQVCLEYAKKDSRIRYRRNERNLGMTGNLNACIADASGEYIADLFDGDLYDPTLLEKWTRALDAYPQAAFVFNANCELDINGNKRKINREPLPECFLGHILLEGIFFKRWRFGSPVFGTVMARSSVYKDVGFFDQRFGFFSDVDMWMRLAERYYVAYINEPLISLPSKNIVPREFTLPFWEEQRTLERIFWEARLRHYHGRYLLLIVEIMRHVSFAIAARSWKLALIVRRRLINASIKLL